MSAFFSSDLRFSIFLLFLSLVQGLKWHNPDFPDIGSGILVHEVVPDSPAQKYVSAKK